MENERLRLTYDSFGRITSLFDKETETEYAAGLCNDIQMYRDVNTCYDAWDIGSMYESLTVPLETPAECAVLCAGPLAAVLHIRRRLHNSELEQYIILEADSRRIEFRTRINWRESHKLLKVHFSTNLHTDEVCSEIQYGYLRRPTHRSRPYDADRYEICNQRWSALAEAKRCFALLNDCKYGLSAGAGRLSLTLLKAARIPDSTADQGMQEFTYSVELFDGPFDAAAVTRAGYAQNRPVLSMRGNLPDTSLFSLSTPDILLDWVKLADDGGKDVVLRLYEPAGATKRCLLKTALPFETALETDLLEEQGHPLSILAEGISLFFSPFEVKTVRLCSIK